MNFKGQEGCILEIIFVVLLFLAFIMNKYELHIAHMDDYLSIKLYKFYTHYLMLKSKKFNFSIISIFIISTIIKKK